MDWANEGMGNRNPIVFINDDEGIEILTKNPKQGTKVTLDASNSYDPDGDNLVFNWWVLSEAGTYAQNMVLSDSRNCAGHSMIPFQAG